MIEPASAASAKTRWLPGYEKLYVDLLGLAGILALFGPGFLHRLLVSFSSDRANDDNQQVTWPLFRYGDPHLFAPDPIADYYLDTHLPLGYHALMRVLANNIDAMLLSVIFGHLCFIVAAVFAFLTGRFLAGRAGAWLAVALLLASDGLLAVTGGGLPRAAGAAITFIALYGFLCDRPRYTALATVLGALFWYSVAVSSGALFAVQCLAPKSWLFDWPDGEALVKRVLMVFIVALLTVACAAPKFISQSHWGRVITNASSAWPEAGWGGRLARHDQLGLINPTETASRAFKSSFAGRASPWLGVSPSLKDKLALSLSLLLFAGLGFFSWNNLAARRILSAMAVSMLLFVVAVLVAPMLYAAGRYIVIIAPWANMFAFVYLSGKFGDWLSMRMPAASRATVQVLAGAVVIFGLGGRPFEQGYGIRIDPVKRQALDAMSQLPKTALIAGWPNIAGMPDHIPLFARRRILLSFETHLPFHEQHLASTREKANAIIDAWFSGDGRSVKSLADRFGVTHLVIDKVLRADASLSYFKPFDLYISTKRQERAGGARWIDAPPAEAIIFENEGFAIVDLGKLG